MSVVLRMIEVAFDALGRKPKVVPELFHASYLRTVLEEGRLIDQVAQNLATIPIPELTGESSKDRNREKDEYIRRVLGLESTEELFYMVDEKRDKEATRSVMFALLCALSYKATDEAVLELNSNLWRRIRRHILFSRDTDFTGRVHISHVHEAYIDDAGLTRVGFDHILDCLAQLLKSQ